MTMITVNRKLLTSIQELNQLISEDNYQDQLFQEITQDLTSITRDLESDKLNLCLLSSELKLVESLRQLLSSEQTLEGTCQLQLHKLPQQPLQAKKPVYSAFLTIEELADGGEIKQTSYKLSPKPVLDVGRKPGCDLSISDDCTRVSGRHLEVRFFAAEDVHSVSQWRVQNADGCKNGTFINGEKLVGSRLLQAGDRLILGDEHLTSKSPALIFQHQHALEAGSTENDTGQPLAQLVNCDILLLIIDAHRDLSEEEKEALEAAKAMAVFEIYLIVFSDQSIEVINLSQRSHSPLTVEDLGQAMAAIDPKKISLIKTKRAWTQIVSTNDRLSKSILNQQEKIRQEMKLAEQQTQASKRKPSQDATVLLKVINEQKVSLFKAIETSLTYSKQDLLDDSLADSIQQRIQDLIDELEAHVVKQNGKKCLELRAGSSDANVNDFIMHFCEQELLYWAEEEWRKIRRHYGKSGLEGLVRSSNVVLKPLCEASSTSFNLSIKQKIEFEKAFESSLKRIPCRIEYREDPVLIYFMKKIRSSVFQVMGILFLLSFLGLSRGSFMRGVVSRITSSPLLSLLALGMIVWLIYKLYKTYQNDRAAEVRKASEKIRQELRNYYQKVIKNRFAEKLVQSLEAALKEEISKFDEGIKFFVDNADKIPTETDTGRTDSKALLKNCQSKLIKLEKKLKDIQKLHDRLQRLGAD